MTNFFKGKKRKHRVKIKGVDLEATKARKFKCYRSHVMLDGREILFGADYTRRVREVLERDGYKCVMLRRGKSCGAPANQHPHHLVKRSAQRDDRADNLASTCDNCHSAAHPEHKIRFGEGRAQAIQDFNKIYDGE